MNSNHSTSPKLQNSSILSSFLARFEPFLKQQIRREPHYTSTAFISWFKFQSSARFSSADQCTTVQSLFLSQLVPNLRHSRGSHLSLLITAVQESCGWFQLFSVSISPRNLRGFLRLGVNDPPLRWYPNLPDSLTIRLLASCNYYIDCYNLLAICFDLVFASAFIAFHHFKNAFFFAF